jgi:hypothetical protein
VGFGQALDLANGADLVGVQTDGGFIKNDNFRFMDQCIGQAARW